MNDAHYRRIFGGSLGAAAGLAYGLSTQYCNNLVLPGFNFYQPPFGPLANMFLWGSAIGLLGLICAWPGDSIPGIFFSSLAGSLMIWGITFAADRSSGELLTNRLIAAAVFMVPLLALLVPLMALHRWVVLREMDGWLSKISLPVRLWVPLALVILAAAAGLSAMYGPVARSELKVFDDLIQQGLDAPDPSLLPGPLTHYLVGNFEESATPNYALAWDGNNINRFGVPRPLSPEPNEEGAAIARFDNGWLLVCVFPARDMQPSCRSFQGALP